MSGNHQPPPPQKKMLREKVAQAPRVNLFIFGVGSAAGWGVRRLHNNVDMFSNPT